MEKYNTICTKISADIKEEFDSEPVYKKMFENQNIPKSYVDDEVTYFLVKKLDSNHTCLAVITLDSSLRKNENYYLQVIFKKM